MPVQVNINICPYHGFKGEPFQACPDFKPWKRLTGVSKETADHFEKKVTGKCYLWDSDDGSCHCVKPKELFRHDMKISVIMAFVSKRVRMYKKKLKSR